MAKCVVPLRVLFSCDVVSSVWLAIWSYHHLRRHSHVLPHPQAVEWPKWCKRRKWDKWQGHMNSLVECAQLATAYDNIRFRYPILQIARLSGNSFAYNGRKRLCRWEWIRFCSNTAQPHLAALNRLNIGTGSIRFLNSRLAVISPASDRPGVTYVSGMIQWCIFSQSFSSGMFLECDRQRYK